MFEHPNDRDCAGCGQCETCVELSAAHFEENALRGRSRRDEPLGYALFILGDAHEGPFALFRDYTWAMKAGEGLFGVKAADWYCKAVLWRTEADREYSRRQIAAWRASAHTQTASRQSA